MSTKFKVHADKKKRKKPKALLRVEWKECGTNEVHSSYVSHKIKNELFLTDDGCMPVADCYLTPEQAAAHPCACMYCREDTVMVEVPLEMARRLLDPGHLKWEDGEKLIAGVRRAVKKRDGSDAAR